MNKRIKELACQLGPIATIGNWGRVEWADNVYPQLGDRLYAAIDLQKFAELIVLECAEQSMSIGRYNTPSGVTPDLSIAIAVGLKKHFGVEE